METLLLTGCISPNKSIKQFGYKSDSLNPKIRLSEYLKAINFYIKSSKFDNIVFVDNSGYNNPDTIKNLLDTAKINGKIFEFLSFSGNENETLKKTHAYGDGECIDYAIDNSELLKHVNNFYKISGRYIINNINSFISAYTDKDTFFFRRMQEYQFRQINTAFFKINKDIYIQYFYDAKIKVGFHDNKGILLLENVYYDIIKSNTIKSPTLVKLPESNIRPIKKCHKIIFKLGMFDLYSLISKIIENILNVIPPRYG